MKINITVKLDVKGGFSSKRGTWTTTYSAEEVFDGEMGPGVLKVIEDLTEKAKKKLYMDEVVQGRRVEMEEIET